MSHQWSGGFYGTADVTPVKPPAVLDTKGKQPSHAGGEYGTNTKTELNDKNK